MHSTVNITKTAFPKHMRNTAWENDRKGKERNASFHRGSCVALLSSGCRGLPHPFHCLPVEMILLTFKGLWKLKQTAKKWAAMNRGAPARLGSWFQRSKCTLYEMNPSQLEMTAWKHCILARRHLPLIYLFLTGPKCECLSQSPHESPSLNLAQMKLENKSNYINYTL